MQTPLILNLQGMEEKRVEILTAVACGHDIRYMTPEWTQNTHPPSVVSLCVYAASHPLHTPLSSVGSDVCASEVVLREGECLGPAEFELMATVGVTKVEVYRRPRVAVLSTGNEVGPIVFKLAPHTVRTPFVCTCAHSCVIYTGSGCVCGGGGGMGEVSVCVGVYWSEWVVACV